ncbi:MAG: hypothetical protein H7A51_03565 [Akkermansiaceae bacterium]|nr:hypothetical protein [Akkermansiaceae bacterium]
MINDLLTSSKGPGVIGLILGLAVLLGFGSLAFLVLEDDSGSKKSIYSQIKEKERYILILGDEKSKWQEKSDDYVAKRESAKKVAELQTELKRKQADIVTSTSAVAAAGDKISITQKKFQDYKEKYRLTERARAVGEKIASLTIKNGKTYEDVVIRRVSAEGMDIRHKNGGTLIKRTLLPDDMLDRFQYSDSDTAIANKNKEARLIRANKGSAAYAKSLQINALKTKLNTRKFELSQLTQSIASAEAAIVSKTAAAERATAKAAEHRSKADAARAQGRQSMQGALAQQEEARAANYLQSVEKLRSYIASKQRESDKTSADISALENELRQLMTK